MKLATMLRTIHECPKPVIARIHGPAFAGGVGLVAACDIAVASLNAEFCLTETKLGLIPATIAPYVLRAMGASQARRYFLTAEKFDASEAFRIGLVHNIVPPEELDGTINELLGTLMLTSAEAVSEAKRLVRDLAFRPIDDALVADTAERIAAIRRSVDGREGIASFLEKRKPRWVSEYEALEAGRGDDEEM
jgi:methylglutaconyl-CoA hydratase